MNTDVSDVPKDKRGFALIMYHLRDIPNVYESRNFSEGIAKTYRKTYTNNKLKYICDGLRWALENPGFDFKNFIPNFNIKQNNEEIVYYFERTYEGMKEFGLCSCEQD